MDQMTQLLAQQRYEELRAESERQRIAAHCIDKSARRRSWTWPKFSRRYLQKWA